MNCQDISRIADSGRFSGMTEIQRRAAEAHVSTCRSCAAVWGTHSRLTELSIPPMPAGLRLRCQNLVTLPTQTWGARNSRRLTLIGGLMAIAATAGILTMQMRGAHAPASESLATATTAESTLVSAIPAQRVGEATADTGRTHGDSALVPVAVTTARRADLPLLPKPEQLDERAVGDLALRELVARYPELVDGPDLEGASYFQAAMAMRPDGDVISSALRIAEGINGYEKDHELYQTMPTDAGKTLIPRYQKHSTVSDGRLLRANLIFRIVVVPVGYDTSRSSNRVREILGSRYNYLLLPSADRVLNQLTILLAPDGTVLKESVELERQEIGYTDIRADDPKDVARMAEDRARRLGIDVSQIGLMGSTRIEDGTVRLVNDGTPTGFVEDKRRELRVSYAWKRGSGESSPTLGQDGVTKPPVDLASALTIVEKQIPDAFTAKPVGSETLMVVLDANGQLIRAGRVDMNGNTPDMMARQLVPGVKTTAFTTVRLTNKAGAAADVRFVWEVPEAGATARE